MSEKRQDFYSPAPELVGKMDLSSPELKNALETIREASPFNTPGIESENFRQGARIVATWSRSEYDKIWGVQSSEVEAALSEIKEAFESQVTSAGLILGETTFSARWTIPDLADRLTDTLHADSHFAFCALTGLPIEYYAGHAKGIIRPTNIREIELPEDGEIRPSHFGEILKFSQQSVHRRGIGAVPQTEPILRMSIRGIISKILG